MSIEEFLLEKLGQALNPIPVLIEEPEENPRPSFSPKEFYVLHKTGSRSNDCTDQFFTAALSFRGYDGGGQFCP